MFINFAIIFFTTALLKLHVKLIKTDFTAYEYLVYKDKKKDLKSQLKNNEIDQTGYEDGIKEALDKDNRKKRSKIVKKIKDDEREMKRKERIEKMQA